MAGRTLKTWDLDSGGKKGSDLTAMVRTRWFHPKTGHLYVINGVVFDSQRERWMYTYVREIHDEEDDPRIVFTHLPEDFHREGRFLKVAK